MPNIYSEEELDQLEQEEHSLTEEALLVMFSSIAFTKTELENELHSFYQLYGKDGVVTYAEARKWVSLKDRRRRINVLLLSIANRFSALFDTLQIDFEKMLSDVVDTEATFFDVEIEHHQVPHEWGGDKLNWYDRLEKDVLAWCVAVQSNIKRSILRRNTLSELLEDLEKQFGSMESVLRGLAITETTANGSIARRTIFELLGISKYKFYTRADERTCEICGSMHGLVFPMIAYEVGVTASPMHPRCRCFEVPIKG